MEMLPANERFHEASYEETEGGGTFRCLTFESIRRLADESGLTEREISIMALERGFVPTSMLKNIGTTGIDGQAALLRSRALVIGCGGIGGYVVELLARHGMGRIRVVDPDIFNESNLNRQNLSSRPALGRPKVEVARERIGDINSAIEVEAVQAEATRENLHSFLAGADVAIDALDNLDDRLALQECCADAGVVMVHGAIAGTCIQVSTIFPGDTGLGAFGAAPAEPDAEKTRGVELEVGTLTTTPALVATIEVIEAVKVVLGKGTPLRGDIHFLDTHDWLSHSLEA